MKTYSQDFIIEACAQLLLDKASKIGSRTKAGKILCDLAEDIRDGKAMEFGEKIGLHFIEDSDSIT